MRFVLPLLAGLCLVWCATIWLILTAVVSPAFPHDIYSKVYGRHGNLCCGGDPVTGDCEALQWDQVHQKGDVFVIDSKRYGAPVLLPNDRIEWIGIPGEVPGTAGHWCGRPSPHAASADQPDPSFVTFCAFIAPGGV